MERPSLHRLREAMRRCSDAQVLPTLVFLYRKRTHRHLRRVRPIDLVFPAMATQLFALILAITVAPDQPFPIAAAGNILVVALAMLPSTRKTAHWVKA